MASPLTIERLREGMQAFERLRDEFQPWPDHALTDLAAWFLLDGPSTVSLSPPGASGRRAIHQEGSTLMEPRAFLLSQSERYGWSEAGFAQAVREMASWDEPSTCSCLVCQPLGGADNVTDELMALVRQGDEAGFRELAGCVMPAGEIDECWAGARRRLGLAPMPPVPPCPVQDDPARVYGRAFLDLMDDPQGSDPLVSI